VGNTQRIRGERELAEAGDSLNCNREFLSFVLREMDRSLLLLIKLEHYMRNSDTEMMAEPAGTSFIHG
jgi:hypothetical protein